MGWGGKRPGAGRKKKAPDKPTKPSKKSALPEKAQSLTQKRMALAMASVALGPSRAGRGIVSDPKQIFRVAEPMKGVLPSGADFKAMMRPTQMAMDAALDSQFWPGEVLNSIVENGMTFLGYPYLSELAQRPEYRVISEIIATEATRKWIRFKSSGDEEKGDKIKALADEFERLEVQHKFAEVLTKEGFFGRMHLYLDVETMSGKGRRAGDRDAELKTPIGPGRGKVSETKCPQGALKRLQCVEPAWTYPQLYNATDPLSPDWYNPTMWYVMGKEVHGTRLLTFIARPVPDMLKPAYNFGGLALSQMVKPYVDIWLQTRQSVADFLHSFSVMVLLTDMSSMLQPGGIELLANRADIFNKLRDNQGLMMIDKNSEDFKNVSASIAGLSDLQAQAQEHQCVQAGTLIRTERGDVPIEEVTIADRVLTRAGYSGIKWVGVTGHRDTLVQIEAGGSVIRVTEEHPVWLDSTNEFVDARNVNLTHRLCVLRNPESTASRSHGEADGSGTQRWVTTGTKKPAVCFIASCGKLIAEKSRTVMRSIIGMVMAPIISLTISKSLPVVSMSGVTTDAGSDILEGSNGNVSSVKRISLRRMIERFFAAEPAKLDTTNCEADGNHIENTRKSALAAEKNTQRSERACLDSVLPLVCSAPVTGVSILNVDLQPVYNIEVDGLPEFYANGILVHNSSVSRIPLVKLLGIQPKGLNATAEGELRAFYDTIESYQNSVVKPHLVTVMNFAMLNLWGEVDPEIDFEFVPLFSLDEKEQSEVDKNKAETGKLLIEGGSISPEEERQRIANTPNSDYQGLDVDDLPEPPAEEGIIPGGVNADDPGGGEADIDNNPVDKPELARQRPRQITQQKKQGVDKDVVIPFGLAHDEWNESDHPRGPDGKFGAGQGATLDPGELIQVGKQMGSNPGGVFEDGAGKKYYVKKGVSRDHVANEVAAARLFAMAGGNTLTYREIPGGGHIATEMVDLDKNRASQLSAKEKAEARKDFVIHAWLANYDAIGTGGDNIGVSNGKVLPLDFGGALAYRAQGKPKDENFGPVVGELENMRDPAIAPDAAKVYSGITDEELKTGAARVAAITDSEIRDAVKQSHAPETTAETLIQRKRYIAEKFGIATDEDGAIQTDEDIWMAADEWKESDHPRDKDGKFSTSGSSGSGGSGSEPTFKTKKEHIGYLLSKGTTPAEVMAKMGWPAVSMPQQAAALGMKLEKYKVDGKTMYKGIPMTAEEKAAAQAAAAEKAKLKAQAKSALKVPDSKAAEQATAAIEKNPVVAEALKPIPQPQFTPAEIAKAKSKFALGKHILPMVPPDLIDKFNAAYTGNNAPKTDGEAAAKIVAFQQLQKINQEKIALKAKEAADKAAAEKAAAEAKAAEDAKKNAAIMSELGITEKEAVGFNALVDMMGGNTADIVASFKQYEKEASKYGYPISGFECALIKNYTDGGYKAINKALRDGSWTLAQNVYVKSVNSALKKMPRHKGLVHRGATLPASEQQKYVAGNVVPEHAFTSTSITKPFGGNTSFKITAIGKRAAHVKKLSHFGGEDEVLFAARTYFHVTKVEGKPGGPMVVHMEELDDEA